MALQTLVIVAWMLCAALFAAYAASIAGEITYVTLADGRRTERRLPLIFRMLLPFAANFRPWLARPAFSRSRERVEKMLVSAGMEGLLSGTEFLALKYLVPIALGGAFAFFTLLLSTLMPGSFIADNTLALIVLGFAYGYLYPMSWLRRTLRRRHNEIMKALPFVLDLLTLSVEAGMDFMGALQRNCERRKLDALNEELIRMIREIQVGTPRRIALKNLSARVGQSDLTSVAHALVQADELGVSIGAILRIQSEQLRGRRFDRAEKLANEAPVKMLVPLLVCIFPSVFIILLGPLIMQAAKNLF